MKQYNKKPQKNQIQEEAEQLNELEQLWRGAPLGSNQRIDYAIAYVNLFPLVYPQYCRPTSRGEGAR